MKNQEYMMTQIGIIAAGKQIRSLRINEFIARIRQAEACAPIVDPTLYRTASGNLSAIRDLAEKLLAVQTAFDDLTRAGIKTALDLQATKEDDHADRAT